MKIYIADGEIIDINHAGLPLVDKFRISAIKGEILICNLEKLE